MKHKRKGWFSDVFYKHRPAIVHGMKNGLPIGLGYFAVSFSLGIVAKHAGLTPFQGFLASALNNASAGEYAGFSLIEASAAYVELALMILITNARYLLMSCALSQRFAPNSSLKHRLLMGFFITDEFFGITVARPGYIDPYYTYGAIMIAGPMWALGTAFGVITGNILPARIVSALSVALYGMFLAIIIPPGRKNKVIAILVALSFILSFVFNKLNILTNLSSGTKTIILTVVISAVAAILFPVKKEAYGNDA